MHYKPTPKVAPAQKPESRTKLALRLMDEKGLTAYAAALEAGVRPVTVYTAIGRANAKSSVVEGRCPTCGAPVDKDGGYIPLTGD